MQIFESNLLTALTFGNKNGHHASLWHKKDTPSIPNKNSPQPLPFASHHPSEFNTKSIIILSWNSRGLTLRVTINTGPGTRGPGTQGPEDRAPEDPRTRGPGTQRSSSVALSFYDRNATCVNVLSSNVRLYRCWSQSPHSLYTLLTLFAPDCAISHYLLAFFIYSSLCKPKNSLLYCIPDYKRNQLFTL